MLEIIQLVNGRARSQPIKVLSSYRFLQTSTFFLICFPFDITRLLLSSRLFFTVASSLPPSFYLDVTHLCIKTKSETNRHFFLFNAHLMFSNLSSSVCTLEREILLNKKGTPLSTCSWNYSSSWKSVFFESIILNNMYSRGIREDVFLSLSRQTPGQLVDLSFPSSQATLCKIEPLRLFWNFFLHHPFKSFTWEVEYSHQTLMQT